MHTTTLLTLLLSLLLTPLLTTAKNAKTTSKSLNWPTATSKWPSIKTHTPPLHTSGSVTHAPVPSARVPPALSTFLSAHPDATKSPIVSLPSSLVSDLRQGMASNLADGDARQPDTAGKSGHKEKREAAKIALPVASETAKVMGTPTAGLNPPLRGGRFPPPAAAAGDDGGLGRRGEFEAEGVLPVIGSGSGKKRRGWGRVFGRGVRGEI